ncbi:unnamed protein product [Adineta steineri]|uniref:Uncharacterized protein n=1 Tax=Adineta steineri TaxID=433720 RepID=A0A815ENE7_9BILA|nr:unnamed protein product [Adineta steineri]CAF1312705.1 unnamed protein product [Adineta steineri]CAF4073343.1 unnamed protein product [Adineta steineri]CAF4122339.1 unnamed protein product [Adineta steineri]
MAFSGAPPSQSLINAAFQSLSSGTSTVEAATIGNAYDGGVTMGRAYGGTVTLGNAYYGRATDGDACFKSARPESSFFGGSISDRHNITSDSGRGFIISPQNLVQVYHSSFVAAVSVNGKSITKQRINGPLAVDKNCLAPDFDYDFTGICDNDKTFRRGNQPYERPCGSYRIALNVKGKFGTNNQWIGMTGDDPNEWPVSYHGTERHNALDIAEEGFKLSKGKRFMYGKGIYSTPELEVAKLYASSFAHESTSYKCVIQNRVNPKYLKVISKVETQGKGIYWLSAADQYVDEGELIRPYGLCLFKV